MTTNLVFGVIINTCRIDLLTGSMDETAKNAIYLFSIAERIAAVTLQLSLSILVWFAVKTKKLRYLFPAAILLHMGMDITAVLCSFRKIPILVIELIIYIYTALCLQLAWFIWNRNREIKRVLNENISS